MLFGPDSTLYVTVGDRDRLCCTGTEDNSLRMKAQALDNHVGKTLRLRDDGSVPPDNPFVGKAGAKPEIFTYGHRNGYGLAVQPETGELWQAEIGPMGGDEVNILHRRATTTAGRSSRWAATTRARSCPISRGRARAWTTRGCSGCRRSARRASCSTRATSFRSWKNSLFVGALTTQSSCSASRSASRRRPSGARALLVPLNVRIRDVQQSPDGYIYVATELRIGGTAADGMVLRIEPTGVPGAR